MAARGPKKKPDHLRLVDGTVNTTRHGQEGVLRDRIDKAQKIGKPVMPKEFKGQAAWAWKRYIEPMWWITRPLEAAAIQFCELWQEFRADPKAFAAGRHAQMRALQAELGLTDERRRTGEPPENSKAKDDLFD